MLRRALKILFLTGMVLGGSYALYQYDKRHSVEHQLQEKVKQLEEQRRQLQQFVSRLTSERRVADIIVTEQVRKGERIESTTLMFVEYARDGSRLPPRFFTIRGNLAHLDALVIKFENDFVEKDDPLRGHSIVLFYRLFGEHQTPAEGFRIDDPGHIPEVYRGDAASAAFEAELWKNFWRLVEDEAYRKSKGVRVAQGESPWGPFNPDRVYNVTLQASGGLNITPRPMDPLFQDYRTALQRQKQPN